MASTPLWSFGLVTSEWLTLSAGLSCVALIAYRWLANRPLSSSELPIVRGAMATPQVTGSGTMIEGRDKLLEELDHRLAHARSYQESYSLFLVDVRDVKKHSATEIEKSLASIASGGELLGRMKEGLYLVGGARLSTWGTNDALTYICERLQQDIPGVELMTGMMRSCSGGTTALDLYRGAYRDRAPFCSKHEPGQGSRVDRKSALVSGLGHAQSSPVSLSSN